MRKWLNPTESAGVMDGRFYFIAKRPTNPDMPQWWFYATDIRGKRTMSTKPGIADRFTGGYHLRQWLIDNPTLVAIEVPHDADKRWKRRQKRF